MNRTRFGVSLAIAALVAFALPLLAAREVPRPGDKVEWYTVKTGDTLEGITEHFLGDPTLWPEIHRLNPGLSDPNFLRPGQRIRVIVERNTPSLAEVTEVSRRVDKKPQPKPWTRAAVGDELKERDGVRTFSKSSARLRFDDGSHLDLTEDSLIFLKEMRTTLRASREQIEIVDGQADLSAKTPPKKPRDIEIVMGSATLTPVDGSAAIETRGRRAPSGAAQVMMYEGDSRVKSAGSSVDVPRGMGTSVEQGKPPAAPEKLLGAARIDAPRHGAELEAGASLRWHAVAGAKSYTVEICRDEPCAELVTRVSGVSDTSWRPDLVERGTLYWRVTPVSASGLDGYPSAAAKFAVRVRVAGSVFEDRTASGATVDALGTPGVRLALWRDGGDGAADGHDDARVAETKSVADGRFTFDSVDPGTYWLVVDSRSIVSPALVPKGDSSVIWADQTYGPVGSLCADGTKTIERATAGPCFGGRRADRSDDSSSLENAEHVARVVVGDEGVEGLRFGFGFGAVTTTRDAAGDGRTIQGSLRQVLENARQLTRGIAVHFIPTTPPPEGKRWWTINLAAPLPPVDSAGTSIDGTAERVENDVLEPARPSLPIGAALVVGAVPVRLERPTRPSLEIVAPQGADAALRVSAEAAVRNLAIRGAVVNLRVTGAATISDLILGGNPEGASADRAGTVGLGVYETGTVTARRLVIRDVAGSGIVVDSPGGAARVDVEHLEMRSCGRPTLSPGIDLRSDGSRIIDTLVDSSGGPGVSIGDVGTRKVAGNQIADSTLLNNPRGVLVRNNAEANVVTTTSIDSNYPGAILVTGHAGTEPVSNRFEANEYVMGSGTPVDLDSSGTLRGDGLSTAAAKRGSTCPADPSKPNGGILRPVILASEHSPYLGGFLLSGWACPGTRLELYRESTDENGTIRWDMVATGAAREDGGFTVTMATGAGEDRVALLATDFANNTSELSDVVKPNDLPKRISGVVLEEQGN